MKRLFIILTLALTIGALSCPSINARGRNNNNNTQHNTPAHSNSSRGQAALTQGKHQMPNNGSQKFNGPQKSHGAQPNKTNLKNFASSNNQGGRPGGGNQGGNQGFGPGGGNMGNNQGIRPGGNSPNNNRPNPSGGNRPGNNGGPINIPNNGPGSNNGFGPNLPSNNWGPQTGFGNGHGPGWGHIPHQAPYRPLMMTPRPYCVPSPPLHFHPGPRYPIINTILGVALGTAINISLDYLYNTGYTITGYTSNAVYLNDVPQLNMIWPNATLYYNSLGQLAGSEFVYSTSYYDMNRYYNSYNSLVQAYGNPVTTQMLSGGGTECSWFGYNNQFVTLKFMSGVAANGTSRFFTILSFGR